MGFDLSNYETVKARKRRFFGDYPDGRIILESIMITSTEAVFKASCYKNKEDQQANLPLATGHAQEFQGKGGMANKFAWLENCEESAAGRCLDNAGYSSNEKCSREEMIKVIEKEKALAMLKDAVREKIKVLSGEQKNKLIETLNIDNLNAIGAFDIVQLEKTLEVLNADFN
jgi:hypothetical protein